MAAIGEKVATRVAESLVDKAMKELQYLCCYKSYVDNYEQEQPSLKARRDKVLKDIEEAKERNENQIESEVQLWLNEADGFIKEDTRGKKKWFGLVTNCFWQYKRGKDFEAKMQRIKLLMEQSNGFHRVARSTGLPGIGFFSSPNFMHFEGRKLTSENLKEALKDDNKFMIGLYGLGGTGKTTMAVEVGQQVDESKVFDKVIFNVVSKDADLKKIRDNIARHLNLPLKEGTDESDQAQELWKRIVEGEEKVLIILDDMWEKLTLRDIGIPPGRHAKGCCSIFLTTRHWRVCRDMECHETIELEVLNENDAVDLFLSFSGKKSTDGSFNDFKDVALRIVKECGRLPVAIVIVARALKSRPLTEWEDALKRLQNPDPVHEVNEDLKEAYHSLRLSYDNLKNEKAKQLFLLCSLFPEDYEIPIELLTRIAIGLGLCGEADSYDVARSHFTPIKNELIDSCLLLKAWNESVKMHDLILEVALWIGNKQVQVVRKSNTTLMENIQYSSWSITDFPNHFDGRKLEVLLVWIKNVNSPAANTPNVVFEGMENLKILALMSWSIFGISAASLCLGLLSLTNLQTLVVRGFKLEHISPLVNLKSLASLELKNCSIIELPEQIRELGKLRLLEIVDCFITRTNPFEVIGSCSQLEELYYASNNAPKSQAQIITFPNLKRYYITGKFQELDFSISRYFEPRSLGVKFSDNIFKSLAERAEVLTLEGDYCNRGWTNIVPNIFSVEDDSVGDHLTRLSLSSGHEIKCLTQTEHLQSGVAIFSKLVELWLYDVHVRELCCGPYPVDFLKQLKKLNLSKCEKFENTLFDGKLELCNLKSIYLSACSMTCLFHPSTAQSLKQLELLEIMQCIELKYIVAETTDDHDPNEESHDSMFPKLKDLHLQDCPELEFVLPICFCNDLPLLERMEIRGCENLKYIFGKYPKERGLHLMGKGAILQLLEGVTIEEVPNFINIYAECYLPSNCYDEVQKSSSSAKVEDGNSSLSGGSLCCFWPKANASTIHHPSSSMITHLNHNKALKMNYVVNGAHGIFTAPLYPYKSLTLLQIRELSGSKSLFSPSIASSLKLLEELDVSYCNTLEHIVTDEEPGHDTMNVISIFPKLQYVLVYNCSHLEYIFPAFYSKDFKDLESVKIIKAEMLTHVFGKCQADQNHNGAVDLNLPAMKQLFLVYTPNMVSICTKNYSMKDLYLEEIHLVGCSKLRLENSIDLLVVGHKRQEDISGKKELSLEKDNQLSNLQEAPEIKDICLQPKSYMTFQNLSILKIQGCKQLKFIFSASTSRRLQKLKRLVVSNCEEVMTITEDEENEKNTMSRHEVCWPELRGIIVKNCKSLTCMFPISCGKLPRLLYVNIEGAPQLQQVFGWKQREEQKLAMDDVLPKLVAIRLVNLPALHTIHHGIDFQTVKIRHVRECPRISVTSSNDSYPDDLIFSTEFVDYDDSLFFKDVREWDLKFSTEFVDDDNLFLVDYVWKWDDKNEEASEEVDEDEEDTTMEEEGSQEYIGNDSTIPQQNNGSSDFENNEEVSKETARKDSTIHKQNSNLPNLTESTSASANEIVEEKHSTNLSYNSDVNTETTTNEIVEEQLPTSNTAAAASSKSDRDNFVHKESTPTLSEITISNSGTPTSSKNEEVSKEIARKDYTTHKQNSNLPNLTESTTASANEIVEEKFSSTLSSNSDVNLETTTNEIVEEQLPISNTAATPSSKSNRELSENESKCDQEALGEATSLNEGHHRVKSPTNDLFTKETTEKIVSAIPPTTTTTTTEMTSLSDPSIATPAKPQIATSTTHTELKSSQSDPFDIPIIPESPQVETMVNLDTSTDGKEIKFDQKKSQISEQHGLMRLFQIMKEGADMEVDMSYVSKLVTDLQDNKDVSKALTDLEGSLKMSLNEIACSEESRLCLENALNILSSHCSEDGVPSHGLQATIHSLQQEIQSILSSFNQAYATIDSFINFELKEKLMIEQRINREKDAKTLLSDINDTKNSIAEDKKYLSEAQLKEAELKEQISELQAKMRSKEKEIKECERKLLSLQEQEKKSVSDTIGFTIEFLAMEKERSHMVENQMKARQQLENMDVEWSSCLSNLKKATMLIGVHLKQKL